MRKLWLSLGLCLLSMQFVLAQAKNYEKAYQQRIQKSTINGVYIPKDLGDCYAELNKRTDAASRAKLKALSEGEVLRKTHFGLGRWIRYNWELWDGSRISHYISTSFGISHPDDISQLIIITYHRFLNKKPVELKALVEKFKEKRKRIRDEQKKPKKPKG